MSGEFQLNRKEVTIHFKNKKDLQNRIVHLWMDQKEDESYLFTFGNKEAEEAFNSLTKAFTVGNIRKIIGFINER